MLRGRRRLPGPSAELRRLPQKNVFSAKFSLSLLCTVVVGRGHHPKSPSLRLKSDESDEEARRRREARVKRAEHTHVHGVLHVDRRREGGPFHMRHGAVCDVASAWYYGCLMSSGHPRFCGLCLCDVALDAIQYGTVRVSCGNYRPIYRGWVSSRAKQCNLVELLVYSLSDRGITVNLIGPLQRGARSGRGRMACGRRRLACHGRRGPESHLTGLQPTYG